MIGFARMADAYLTLASVSKNVEHCQVLHQDFTQDGQNFVEGGEGQWLPMLSSPSSRL